MSGKMKLILKIAVCLVLVTVMGISALRISETQAQYEKEELLHQSLLVYKPISLKSGNVEFKEPGEPSTVALLRMQYPNVVGWITIPGTRIDYPFMQAEDNDQYLDTDINGDYLFAGSIFLDYRCLPDLSLYNSVIYGHNMNNSSMFGTLPSFRDSEFFEQITEGMVYLEETEYRLEIFACILTNNYDGMVYNSLQNTSEEKTDFLQHIKDNATQYREIGVSENDRFLTLSTCSYEFADARTVVIGRLAEI